MNVDICACVFSTTSVDYLEADLGQTEFTPAGCLSLSTVKDPILGMFYFFSLLQVISKQSKSHSLYPSSQLGSSEITLLKLNRNFFHCEFK